MSEIVPLPSSDDLLGGIANLTDVEMRLETNLETVRKKREALVAQLAARNVIVVPDERWQRGATNNQRS